MPILIKYTFENQTVLNIAKYLLIHKTGSHQTLYQYVYGAHRITETINETPDQLITRCKTNEDYQDQKQTQQVIRQIDEFIGEQAQPKKYFKKQTTKLVTINADYIEHIMGHVTNTYTDIEDTRQLDKGKHQRCTHLTIPTPEIDADETRHKPKNTYSK